MKVAIVHDDLVQWGGAERVLLGICEIFPNAPIYTSVYDKTNSLLLQKFGTKKIITSFLQKIPGWRNFYKALLPLYPIAFEQFSFDKYDLVISHTTRFAKAVISKPQTLHLSYCHTPPRFLWHLSSEIYPKLDFLLNNLRIYDQISSRRVDFYIAGSKNAQKRIKKIYRRDSKVLYPFVDLDRFKNVETFDGGYFLVVSRLNKYKKVNLAIEACVKLGLSLKVIGIGPELRNLQVSADRHQNVEMLGSADEELLVKVLAGCRALIVPGEEDFGLVSLEAQVLGKPVIAYNQGGSCEALVDSKTGILFSKQNILSIKDAINKLSKARIDPQACKKNAERFNKEKFKADFKQIVAQVGYTIN